MSWLRQFLLPLLLAGPLAALLGSLMAVGLLAPFGSSIDVLLGIGVVLLGTAGFGLGLAESMRETTRQLD